MRSATIAPEKGAHNQTTSLRSTQSSVTPYANYRGLHNTNGGDEHAQFSPSQFRLEQHLDNDHPLRHPKAVNWRSAYSVISLHKKMKSITARHENMKLHTPRKQLTNLNMPPLDYESLKEENNALRSQLKDAKKRLEEKEVSLQDARAQLKHLEHAGVNVKSIMEKVQEMENFRQKLIAKAALRWKNAGILGAFRKWHAFAIESVKNRNLIARFSARWNNNSLAGVFVRWHDKTKQEKKNRLIIRKFASRFKKQLEFKCFSAWHNFTTESGRLKNLYYRVAQRFKQRHLASAFGGWFNNVHEILNNRALLKKFSLRMKNSHLISSFATWHHFSTQRIDVRNTMAKFLKKLINADEIMAFEQWKRFSRWYEKHAHESDKHTLTMRIRDLELKLQSCEHELDEFRQVFSRKREKFIAALKSRVQHQKLQSLWNRWDNFVYARISARNTINKLLNRQLAMGLKSWILHDKHLKEETEIREKAAKEKKNERERKKALLNKTLRHMQQLKLASTFRKWRDDVREIIQNRVIIARFVGRWQNQDLHMRFSLWLEFTDEIIRRKAIARKVLNRITHSLETSAIQKWVEVVEYLKNEQEKKHHDELVLERFIRRWKSLDLHKRFDRWKSFWIHEKHHRSTQQQLAALREEYEAKLGGIKEVRRKEREHRVRKAIAAWLNNNLSHCFHRWRELVTRLIRERNTVAKFILQWQKTSLVAAYRAWVAKVRHKKRCTRIVLNMWRSRSRRTQMKCFRSWSSLSVENAKNKRLLKRFAKRWRNLELAAVWTSWVAFIEQRIRARSMVTKFYNRWQNGRLSKGFRAWVSYSVRYEIWLEGQQLVGEAQRQRKEAAAQELRDKQKRAQMMLRHLMQRHLSVVFRTWKENVHDMVYNRTVIARFLARYKKQNISKAILRWQDFVMERVQARKVIIRLMHRSMLDAFRLWNRNVNWLAKWSSDKAVRKLEELSTALEGLRKRVVRRLLQSRVKEILSMAIQAWHIAMLHLREEEHIKFEAEEHRRLQAALAREEGLHQRYEQAILKGGSRNDAKATLDEGLKKMRQRSEEDRQSREAAIKAEEDSKAQTLVEYQRLEEALAHENEIRSQFKAALESGALSDHQKRSDFEKRLARAHERTTKERERYKAALTNRMSVKTKASKTFMSHAEKSDENSSELLSVSSKGTSSVWKKYKSLMRSAGKKGEASGGNHNSEKKVESAVSVWALARKGTGRPGGRKRHSAGIGKVNELMRESSGRATQRILEQLNDLMHQISTVLTIEKQSSIISMAAPLLLSADVVNLFVREDKSFWACKNENPKERENWSLSSSGSLVAECIVKGHIIDLADATENAAYRASPDCHVNGEQGVVKKLAVLIVPIVDAHGKTVGALRASRSSPVKGSNTEFGSVHSLLMCIIAAALQCIWNNSMRNPSGKQNLIVKSSRSKLFDKTRRDRGEENGWKQILTQAINDFDASHAATIKRLAQKLPAYQPQQEFKESNKVQQSRVATSLISGSAHRSLYMTTNDLNSDFDANSTFVFPQAGYRRRGHGVVSFIHNELI